MSKKGAEVSTCWNASAWKKSKSKWLLSLVIAHFIGNINGLPVCNETAFTLSCSPSCLWNWNISQRWTRCVSCIPAQNPKKNTTTARVQSVTTTPRTTSRSTSAFMTTNNTRTRPPETTSTPLVPCTQRCPLPSELNSFIDEDWSIISEDTISIQCRYGYMLDTQAAYPEELDPFLSPSNWVIDCHVPIAFLAQRKRFIFRSCCSTSQHIYSVRMDPPNMSVPLNVISSSDFNCNSDTENRTYFENLEISADPEAWNIALSTAPYLWQDIWNDKGRKGQAALMKKPLRILVFNLPNTTTMNLAIDGFVVVGKGIYIGLPSMSAFIQMRFPIDSAALMEGALSLLQYDSLNYLTLKFPDVEQYNFASEIWQAVTNSTPGCTFVRDAMVWDGACDWDLNSPTIPVSIPLTPSVYTSILSVASNAKTQVPQSTCYGEDVTDIEGLGPVISIMPQLFFSLDDNDQEDAVFSLGSFVSSGQLCPRLYGRYSDVGLAIPAEAWFNTTERKRPGIQLFHPTSAMKAALTDDQFGAVLAGPVLHLTPMRQPFAANIKILVPFEFESPSVSPRGYLMDSNTSSLNFTVRRYDYNPTIGAWNWVILPSSTPMKTGPSSQRTFLLSAVTNSFSFFAVVKAGRMVDNRNCIFYDMSCFLSLVLGTTAVLAATIVVTCFVIIPTLWHPDEELAQIDAAMIYTDVDPFAAKSDDENSNEPVSPPTAVDKNFDRF